jgi:hypothetical protein
MSPLFTVAIVSVSAEAIPANASAEQAPSRKVLNVIIFLPEDGV